MKKQKKLLIPGLGIGKSMGICDSCNMSFGELFLNPSVLLWADKICIPDWCVDMKHDKGEQKADYAVRTMLDILGENQMLECIEDDKFKAYGKTIGGIERFVTEEMEALALAVNKKIKDDIFLILGKDEYCLPYLQSSYASVLFAHSLGARCLFDARFRKYINYRSKYLVAGGRNEDLKTEKEIFSAVLPNDFSMPEYLFEDPKHCAKCRNELTCSKELGARLKKCLNQILGMRDDDVFQSLRDVVDKVIRESEGSKCRKDSADILDDLRARALEIQKRERGLFPKVERWSNFALAFSLPTACAAAGFGEPVTMAIAGAISAAAKTTESIMKFSRSRNRWVDFFNKDRYAYVSKC